MKDCSTSFAEDHNLIPEPSLSVGFCPKYCAQAMPVHENNRKAQVHERQCCFPLAASSIFHVGAADRARKQLAQYKVIVNKENRGFPSSTSFVLVVFIFE
jgi:hypothetical protein